MKMVFTRYLNSLTLCNCNAVEHSVSPHLGVNYLYLIAYVMSSIYISWTFCTSWRVQGLIYIHEKLQIGLVSRSARRVGDHYHYGKKGMGLKRHVSGAAYCRQSQGVFFRDIDMHFNAVVWLMNSTCFYCVS